MKVAIVGLADGRADPPFEDPNWEVWGFLFDPEYWWRFDRVFEMHDPAMFPDYAPENYIERFSDANGLVYHQDAYPLGEVVRTIGADYFVCSLSYALALAIHMRATSIDLIGFEALDEYADQRCNSEYLIGLARGRGIDVTWPQSASFLTYEHPDFPDRYGYM